ncbi:hypothetical protein WDZ92_50255, partial [Nostoc sp. NIES-2111]
MSPGDELPDVILFDPRAGSGREQAGARVVPRAGYRSRGRVTTSRTLERGNDSGSIPTALMHEGHFVQPAVEGKRTPTCDLEVLDTRP